LDHHFALTCSALNDHIALERISLNDDVPLALNDDFFFGGLLRVRKANGGSERSERKECVGDGEARTHRS
jgi:hypothetical protein